jgi:hypothetical protein
LSVWRAPMRPVPITPTTRSAISLFLSVEQALSELRDYFLAKDSSLMAYE